MTQEEIIAELQTRLAALGDEKKRQWWERYMKGVIPFRGVGIPQIRELLEPWRWQTGLAEQEDGEQLELALALFERPMAEDKLAGILYLQLYLAERLSWRALLPEYAKLYQRRLIFDWNICDWFCVRVLGPALVENGEPFAKALSTWRNAEYLWQARSALVPFIKVAGDARFYPYVGEISATLIQREERFAKTAVGWVLRDVSRHDQGLVERFIETHARVFSLESVRNATKYFDESTKAECVARVKKSRAT